MKKTLLFIVIALSLSAKAQITLNTTIVVNSNGSGLRIATLAEGVEKYYGFDSLNLTLYNLDGSIYKLIPLPVPFANIYDLEYVSETLFNNDTLVEYMVMLGGIVPYSTRVYNEEGSVVFRMDNYYFDNIYSTTAGTMMEIDSTDNSTYKIYSLPGSLVCNACGVLEGINAPGNNTGSGLLNAYPNPFTNLLTLEYRLAYRQNAKIILTTVDGREVKNLALTSQADKLTINAAGLPKGILIASLYGDNQQLLSKKLVKIE